MIQYCEDIVCKAQHACTLCPTSQRRRTPPSHSNKLKLWIVSGAELFCSFFFHGHQQTNRNGARCLSTAWGRTSSCEFPWPKCDSEWLRAAGKITGEVTKWCCWERLETERRHMKQEGRELKCFTARLKVILRCSDVGRSQCGGTEKTQRDKIMSQIWDHVVTSIW